MLQGFGMPCITGHPGADGNCTCCHCCCCCCSPRCPLTCALLTAPATVCKLQGEAAQAPQQEPDEEDDESTKLALFCSPDLFAGLPSPAFDTAGAEEPGGKPKRALNLNGGDSEAAVGVAAGDDAHGGLGSMALVQKMLEEAGRRGAAGRQTATSVRRRGASVLTAIQAAQGQGAAAGGGAGGAPGSCPAGAQCLAPQLKGRSWQPLPVMSCPPLAVMLQCELPGPCTQASITTTSRAATSQGEAVFG